MTKHSTRRSAFADAAIAIGIAGEIALGTIWNNRIQTELRKRSNEQLTSAVKSAADAQLELVKFRTPRAVLLTPKALALITEKLRPFADTAFDCGMGTSGEQADFWWNLQPALLAAGWQHLAWQYPSGPLPMLIRQGMDRPPSGSVGAANVEIHLRPEHRQSLLAPANALIEVLTEIGIAVRDAGYNAHSINNTAVHILIGPKE